MRLDAESTATRLARRERQLEEVLARAQKAEAELGRAQTAEKDAIKRAQALEKATADAQARSQKAESERRSLADGLANLRSSFKAEALAVRTQLDELRTSFESIVGQQARKQDERTCAPSALSDGCSVETTARARWGRDRRSSRAQSTRHARREAA